MQTAKGSFHNLASLGGAGDVPHGPAQRGATGLAGPGGTRKHSPQTSSAAPGQGPLPTQPNRCFRTLAAPAWHAQQPSTTLLQSGSRRLIVVSHQLPVRVKKGAAGQWLFEWDEDALVAQAKVGQRLFGVLMCQPSAVPSAAQAQGPVCTWCAALAQLYALSRQADTLPPGAHCAACLLLACSLFSCASAVQNTWQCACLSAGWCANTTSTRCAVCGLPASRDQCGGTGGQRMSLPAMPACSAGARC